MEQNPLFKFMLQSRTQYLIPCLLNPASFVTISSSLSTCTEMKRGRCQVKYMQIKTGPQPYKCTVNYANTAKASYVQPFDDRRQIAVGRRPVFRWCPWRRGSASHCALVQDCEDPSAGPASKYTLASPPSSAEQAWDSHSKRLQS